MFWSKICAFMNEDTVNEKVRLMRKHIDVMNEDTVNEKVRLMRKHI